MAALLGLSLAMTLGVSFLLSKTALKGLPSFFALELPPYRRPQVGQVLVRSVLDQDVAGSGAGGGGGGPGGGAHLVFGECHLGRGEPFSPTAPGFWSPLPASLAWTG